MLEAREEILEHLLEGKRQNPGTGGTSAALWGVERRDVTDDCQGRACALWLLFVSGHPSAPLQSDLGTEIKQTQSGKEKYSVNAALE